VLLDYLAANWSPRPLAAAAAPAAATEGAATVFARACLVCHETDIIAQQRLERAGWVREVDKMVRWGATVTEAERNLLIDYLAGRFRPTGQVMSQ
jgi:mono/diheme cytochrome c family protein